MVEVISQLPFHHKTVLGMLDVLLSHHIVDHLSKLKQALLVEFVGGPDHSIKTGDKLGSSFGVFLANLEHDWVLFEEVEMQNHDIGSRGKIYELDVGHSFGSWLLGAVGLTIGQMVPDLGLEFLELLYSTISLHF